MITSGGVMFMATIIKAWSKGSVSIAVESGKDDMNREGTHVHVYKNGRRTESRIPGRNKGLDNKDYYTAETLYDENLYEIDKYCADVKNGKYDS